MKKIIYTLFVLVFLFGLFSCGEKIKIPKCEEIKGIKIEIEEVPNLPYNLGYLEEDDEYYSQCKKYKDYTGILKMCDEDGYIIEYANYKNGKKDGGEFCYFSGHNFFTHGNVFDIIPKPQLTETTFKDGEPIKSCEFYSNGEKSSEETQTETEIENKNWYENGQLARLTIQDPISYNIVIEEYWDENGKKIKKEQYERQGRFNFLGLNVIVYDLIGIGIIPFTLGILLIIFLIRRRKKKKLKKTD